MVVEDVGKGNIEFNSCPECGVPQNISRISWDIDSGIITDVVNGRRVAIIGADILGVAFALLAEEMGGHVLSRWWRRNANTRGRALPGDAPEQRPPELLASLRCSRARRHHRRLSENTVFKIRHPFNPHFMAGRVLGFYEAWRGERVAAAWRVSEWGTAYVTIYN